MMIKKQILFVSISLIMFLFSAVYAEEKDEQIEVNNILVVIDCSNNMNKYWDKVQRIDVVRKSFKQVLKKVSEKPEWGLHFGIRVFGDKSLLKLKDCLDTRLATPVEWFDPITLSGVIDGLRPKGKATLSQAIQNAVNDYPRTYKAPYNFLVVITSTDDECGEDVVQAVNFIKNERTAVDAVHFVGIQLSQATEEKLKKAAEVGGGTFANAKTHDDLTNALLNAINIQSRTSVSAEPTPKPTIVAEPTSTKTP
ncbi:VWA domain-containing protein [bacterium]|nr:VWA domain-containing protein [candidate division CSSED10-310 bacterium]